MRTDPVLPREADDRHRCHHPTRVLRDDARFGLPSLAFDEPEKTDHQGEDGDHGPDDEGDGATGTPANIRGRTLALSKGFARCPA